MLNSILIEGLIYGIMVLGVFSTFRVLNFCDMTVDGSFPLGACVLAACLTAGIPPVAAIFIAFLSGLVAGIATSAIYTKLKIPDLLAGILTMTMLYSVNLRIMSNKANIFGCITITEKSHGIPVLRFRLKANGSSLS